MVQHTRVVLVDDLDGTEVENGETINFAVNGTAYEIDLGQDHAAEFHAQLGRWVAAARRTRPAVSVTQLAKRSAVGLDAEQRKHVRQWARENGHPVPLRGRLSDKVLDAYQEAHQSGKRAAG